MNATDSLLRAILEDPRDDAARMAYADLLMEGGDPRGEFIAVQLELAAGGCACTYSHHNRSSTCALCRRERELLDRVSGAECLRWIDLGLSAEKWEFRRGFVAVVHCTLAAWERHGGAVVAATPVEEVVLTDREPLHEPAPFRVKYPWSWATSKGHNSPHSLPIDFGPHLKGTQDPAAWNDWWWHYDTKATALADLSRACVAWARQKAGLPRIT